jgi:hypothetical protein
VQLTAFNGSPRGQRGNTEVFVQHLIRGFESGEANSSEVFYLNHVRDTERHVQAFSEAELVLLAFPLYTDAMPAQVKTFIEALEPLCDREGNPDLAFLVQSGFPEALHSRHVERYLVKLSARLGCRYVGTIVKGGGEGARLAPDSYSKPFEILRQLGVMLGETGTFDEALLKELAKPERFPKLLAPAFKLFLKTKMARSYWDNQLKENGAYEDRFARPYAQ